MGDLPSHVLLSVPEEERQVEGQRQPVAVDEEKARQQRVDGGFGDEVRVQAVAEVDRVDVVTVKKFAASSAKLNTNHETAKLACAPA